MITEDTARKQLETLHQEGSALAEEFGAEQRRRPTLYPKQGKRMGDVIVVTVPGKIWEEEQEEKQKKKRQAPEPPLVDEIHFEERYQSWYSRALPLMKQLAQDRYAEFQSLYVVDPRYPWCKPDAYVIQDFFRARESAEAGVEAARCFKNQLAILKSVRDRLEWQTLTTDDQVERALQLELLKTARDLIKISERAAGALAGTMLQVYLKKLAARHQLKLRKQSPSPEELAKALKAAKVIDVPVHSQLTWLAEIYARVTVKEGGDADSAGAKTRPKAKGEAPTKLQVRDLIDGTHWLIINVF